LSLCYEDVLESEYIGLSFLDLGSSWKRVARFTLRSLYPEYPIDGTRSSVMIKALRYKPEGCGFETR
jgi:hypothetical protein